MDSDCHGYSNGIFTLYIMENKIVNISLVISFYGVTLNQVTGCHFRCLLITDSSCTDSNSHYQFITKMYNNPKNVEKLEIIRKTFISRKLTEI